MSMLSCLFAYICVCVCVCVVYNTYIQTQLSATHCRCTRPLDEPYFVPLSICLVLKGCQFADVSDGYVKCRFEQMFSPTMFRPPFCFSAQPLSCRLAFIEWNYYFPKSTHMHVGYCWVRQLHIYSSIQIWVRTYCCMCNCKG